MRIVGKIILNFVGNQTSKTELSDTGCSSQILIFLRFIDFCDYSLGFFFFYWGMGIILI